MIFKIGKKEEEINPNSVKAVLPEVYEGSVCELKSMENAVIATGVVGEITEDYIRLDSRGTPFPMQPYGTNIKINVFNSREGFRVLVGKVYAASTGFLKLIEVVSLLDYERRNFFRIVAESPAWVAVKDQENVTWKDVAEVRIHDISLGGALIEWPESQVELGGRFHLRLKLGRFHQVVECAVSRIDQRKGVPIYGCEFVNLSTVQSDAICQYIFQRQREQLQSARLEKSSMKGIF